MSTINKEVIDAFVSTLQDLTVNSKPLINVLTMIADENEPYSKNIVEAIETHLSKVRLEVKLPILYLIDCIIKNVGRSYMQHFCQNIVTTFCSVFQVVDEKTRAEMFKLRQTWNDVLPKAKLYAMDVQIRQIDPAWPITAHLHPIATNTIHVNPKFLTANTNAMKKEQSGVKSSGAPAATPPDPATLVMQQKLLIKQKELVELQQKKIELELLQTKVKLEEEKLKSQLVGNKPVTTPKSSVDTTQSKSHNLLLKPEVAKQLDNGCSEDQSVAQSKSQFVQSISTQQQLYTIPKQSQQPSNRFAGAASTRDPRLARLQQQTNSNNATIDSTAANIVSNMTVPPVQSGNNIKKKHHVKSPNKLVKRQTKSNSPTALVSDKSKASLFMEAPATDKPTRQKNINNRYRQNPLPSSGSPFKSIQAKSSDVNMEQHEEYTFRGMKGGASKRRNYVRRNSILHQEPQRVLLLDESEVDTEPTSSLSSIVTKVADQASANSSGGDTDLRSLDSFVVPSGRRENIQSPKLDLALKGVDVDLRQIPTSNSPSSEKKRSSTAADDNGTTSIDSPPAKKSKSQVLDALFGSEDVDLRQATATTLTARPTTPPPPPAPIISAAKSTPPPSTQKEATTITKVSIQQEANVKKANLDALRAKLANVSNKEKLKEKKEQKAVKETKISAAPTTAESLESAIMKKIIMSTEDVDSIKAGKLSKEQEIVIMAKIKSHFESEKLAQAKLKEKEDEEQQQQQLKKPSQIIEELGNSDDDEVVEVIPLVPLQNSNVPLSSTAAATVQPLLEEGVRLLHPRTRAGYPRGMLTHPWRNRTGNNRWEPLNPQHAAAWQQPNVGNNIGSNRGTYRWRDAIDRPSLQQPMPEQHIIPPPPMPPPVIDITQSDQPMLLQSTSPSDARSINIDSFPRDIRFYDQTAIVFMAWDDPREISFQHGARRVIFDDADVYLLQFNDTEWTEVAISGQMHRVKLGAPTRELWLDGRWYEAVFGGRDVPIEIDGRVGRVKLEGPPPQVRIGTELRTDLVCGKIQIIVDAKTIIPVFLDSRVQQITISPTQLHQLQFVDALRAVRFDGGDPIAVEFGGLPKPVHIAQRKHFVRFSVLPRGIRPGYVKIQGMEGEDRVLPLPMEFPPVLPHIPSAEELAGVPVAPPSFPQLATMDDNSQDSQQNLGGNFDALSNAANVSLNTSESEYHVETINSPHHQQHQVQQKHAENIPQTTIQSQSQSQLGNVLNINDLFQKLIATGIVSTKQSHVQEQQPQKSGKVTVKETMDHKQVVAPFLQPVDWTKTETLKTRQSGLLQLLYSGMQCSSCGERFPAVTGGSRMFSQHLDWHFRQNRRGKNSARNRKATSRRWYYSLSDWKQYEEIEDLREREKNFFENQQQSEDNESTLQDQLAQDTLDQDVLVSVACDPETTDPHCSVCDDRFEQFYNEELEEWHLRNAISVDGQIYHPICYKDQQMAQQTANVESAQIPGLDMEQETVTEATVDDNSCVEQVQVIQLDDEEEEEENIEQLQENEIEVIDESVQDAGEVDDDDDDVILNEVLPEQIILDEYEWRDGQEPADIEIGLIPGVVVKVEPLDDGFMDVGDSLQKPQEPEVKDEASILIAEEVLTENLVKDATENANDENRNQEEQLMVVDSQDKQMDQLEQGDKQNDATMPIAIVIKDTDIEMVQQQQQQQQPSQIGAAVDPLMANIDGNIDMSDNTTAASQPHGNVGRIRINISKAHTSATSKISNVTATSVTDHVTPLAESNVSAVVVDPSQPLPPGEEPPLKPGLRGLALRRQTPVNIGTELTGLCSIM